MIKITIVHASSLPLAKITSLLLVRQNCVSLALENGQSQPCRRHNYQQGWFRTLGVNWDTGLKIILPAYKHF